MLCTTNTKTNLVLLYLFKTAIGIAQRYSAFLGKQLFPSTTRGYHLEMVVEWVGGVCDNVEHTLSKTLKQLSAQTMNERSGTSPSLLAEYYFRSEE